MSQTDEEIPSLKTLLTEAAPRADKIFKSITALIDEEEALAATRERKQLLKYFADSRGSFSIGLANIRAYLLSGNTDFRDAFNGNWAVNQDRLEKISSMQGLLNARQQADWKDYSSVLAEFASLPPRMFAERSAADWNKANFLLATEAAPRAARILDIVHEINGVKEKERHTDEEVFRLAREAAEATTIIGTVLAVILGIVVAGLIANGIVTPLLSVVARAKEISKGDLTSSDLRCDGKDELTALTYAINDMQNNLQSVIKSVTDSSNDLAAASTQLEESASSTSDSMNSQQREIEQIATAMHEMSATVQEVASSAASAATSASDADKAAAEGGSLISANMSGINQLAASIGEASETINQLGDDTNNVDSILAVISDIADQTNLLALNAAIEAARAGEQGRGFAVVADEVRTLAARTQDSTEEIRNMMGRLKAGAKDGVNAMHQGQSLAKGCVEQAKTSSEAILTITDSVSAINDMNTQIALKSKVWWQKR